MFENIFFKLIRSSVIYTSLLMKNADFFEKCRFRSVYLHIYENNFMTSSNKFFRKDLKLFLTFINKYLSVLFLFLFNLSLFTLIMFLSNNIYIIDMFVLLNSKPNTILNISLFNLINFIGLNPICLIISNTQVLTVIYVIFFFLIHMFAAYYEYINNKFKYFKFLHWYHIDDMSQILNLNSKYLINHNVYINLDLFTYYNIFCIKYYNYFFIKNKYKYFINLLKINTNTSLKNYINLINVNYIWQPLFKKESYINYNYSFKKNLNKFFNKK